MFNRKRSRKDLSRKLMSLDLTLLEKEAFKDSDSEEDDQTGIK